MIITDLHRLLHSQRVRCVQTWAQPPPSFHQLEAVGGGLPTQQRRPRRQTLRCAPEGGRRERAGDLRPSRERGQCQGSHPTASTPSGRGQGNPDLELPQTENPIPHFTAASCLQHCGSDHFLHWGTPVPGPTQKPRLGAMRGHEGTQGAGGKMGSIQLLKPQERRRKSSQDSGLIFRLQ